jgi:hypothetical protein
VSVSAWAKWKIRVVAKMSPQLTASSAYRLPLMRPFAASWAARSRMA